MEPYNPNKSFISFRLNPDAIKEELRGIIPGYRAMEYFRNNPDSSITNTLDLLAEDVVPFYAAHKYGANPGDYIKEALLVGTPTKFSRMRYDINNNRKVPGPYYEVNIDRQPTKWSGDPKGTLAAKFKDNKLREIPYGYIPEESAPGISTEGAVHKIGNSSDALKYIDDSEKYIQANPNPYDYKISLNEPMVKEGNELVKLSNIVDDLKYYYKSMKDDIKYQLKPGESFVIEPSSGDIGIKDSKGNYYGVNGDGKYPLNFDKSELSIMNTYPTYKSIEDLGAGVDYFEKQYKSKVNNYNAIYGDDVYYKDYKTWRNDMNKEADVYYQKQAKDFYENVNPKQPWPYGE